MVIQFFFDSVCYRRCVRTTHSLKISPNPLELSIHSFIHSFAPPSKSRLASASVAFVPLTPPPVVAPVVVDSFATTAALARSNSLVNAKRSVNPHSTSSNRRSDAPSLSSSSSSSRNVNRSITRADDPIPRPPSDDDVVIVVSDVPARTPILHETSTNDVGIVRIKNSNARQSEART